MKARDSNLAATQLSAAPPPHDFQLTEELFRSFSDNIEQIIWITQVETGQILYINSAYERIFGLPVSTAYAEANSFLNLVHPEDVPAVKRYLERRQFGRPAEQLYRIIRKDGALRWIWARAYPIHNEAGEFYRLVGIVQDITEQKLLEEELLHTKKMKAIGELAGGVAHDFNNLLTPILGYSSLLLRGRITGARVKRISQVIHQAASRASELTQQLLVFGRKGPQQVVPVDLHRTLNEVIELAERTFEKRVEIVRSFDSERFIVEGDPGQMHQVFLNLAINARDALHKKEGGGRICFSTAAITLDHQDQQQPGIAVTVSDNGSGMDEAVKARMFEPFFTTKPMGRGTGLGLATVYGIVSSHGGTTAVESTPGEGTSITVNLPVCLEERKVTSKDERVAPENFELSVLVVDDDLSVCTLAEELLTELGCDVFAFQDAEEALEWYREHAAKIDVILLDMLMPKLNGLECMAELRLINPQAKIVLTSGYRANRKAASAGTPNKRVPFLQKPYTYEQLSQLIYQTANERE